MAEQELRPQVLHAVAEEHPSKADSPERQKDASRSLGIQETFFPPQTKLGVLAISVLAIGLVVSIAAIGFLWFLWMGNDSNKVWRDITADNWVTRAIALSSVVIRQSVAFQASTATAMLAALAIEKLFVLLLNLASVSTTRNANAGPYMLFWWLWKAFVFHNRRWRNMTLPIVIAILVLTSTLVQLTSFALLSDIDLVLVMAKSENRTLPTNFKFDQNGALPLVTHGTTWTQKLSSYVSFAEYHEPSLSNLPEGTEDTGLTLRAFLPIVDSQIRPMIATWEGRATVLDARVVCLRPDLVDPRVHYADGSLALTSTFQPNLSDLDSLNLVYLGANTIPRLQCILPLSLQNDTGYNIYDHNNRSDRLLPWRLVICQPNFNAGSNMYFLQSELQTRGTESRDSSTGQDPDYSFGNLYIVANVSSGTADDWARAIPGEDPNLGSIRGNGTSPLAYGIHGDKSQWYDLIYSEDARLNLSVSLCYTAFDTADLRVNIKAAKNHSDLNPLFDKDAQTFDYGAIRMQFGQELNGTVTYRKDHEARRIMSLEKRKSWIPEPDFGDYVPPSKVIFETSWITDYANMAGSLQSNAYSFDSGTFHTMIMWQANQIPNLWQDSLPYKFGDASLIELTQEILQSGGSIAFAMQSVVTYLTQLAYYQQLQQLNDDSEVTNSSYVLVSAPVKTRGLLAVTIVVGVHLILIYLVILPLFLTQTKISALGNAWQAVSQIYDEKTRPILEKAPLATDSEAEKAVCTREPPRKSKKVEKLSNHEIIGIVRARRNGHLVKVVSAGDRTVSTSADMDSEGSGLLEE